MTTYYKAVIFNKDNNFKVYTKLYDSNTKIVPSHIDLFSKAIKDGYTDQDLLGIATGTTNPYTIDIYPRVSDKLSRLIRHKVYSHLCINIPSELLEDLIHRTK